EPALAPAVGGEAVQVVVEVDRAPPLVAEDPHDGIESPEILVQRHRELPARLCLVVGAAAEGAVDAQHARTRCREVTGEPATGHAHRSNAPWCHGSLSLSSRRTRRGCTACRP